MAIRQGWAVRVGAVGETQIRVHITMIFLIAWYAWMGWQNSGSSGALDEVVFIVLLFASVLLHEFGHIFAARHYGIGTPDVLLTPIGGIARIASLPKRPSQELVIALAGPLVTLAIVLALTGAFVVGGGRSLPIGSGFLDLPLWSALLYTNVILLLFNMIPAFPMDGGRVLRALLAMRLGLVRGTRIAARVGQAIAAGFALFGLTHSPILLLIAGFVFLGAQAELEAVQASVITDRLDAAHLLTPDLVELRPDITLDGAMRIAVRSDQAAFPVTDPDRRLLGVLTRDDLLRGIAEAGLDATLAVALQPVDDLDAIAPDTPFNQAMQRLQQSGRDLLPVVDGAGRFVGLITAPHVTALLTAERTRRGITGT